MVSQSVAEALAVTAELCGGDISEAAAKIMLADLANYPERAVLDALVRLRREHKGRLSLAAIIERIDDGHPGAEEAWAMVPKTEYDTGVMTRQMGKALHAVQHLIDHGDMTAARMAFRETYTREVTQARAAGVPAAWEPSVGWDEHGRVAVLGEAVKAGRIALEAALHHVTGERVKDLLELASKPVPQLVAKQGVRDLVKAIAAKNGE